jgi:hypothetical protein
VSKYEEALAKQRGKVLPLKTPPKIGFLSQRASSEAVDLAVNSMLGDLARASPVDLSTLRFSIQRFNYKIFYVLEGDYL